MAYLGSGQHPSRAPGFGTAPDPFASISQGVDEDEEALNFEDTYDGLGDQLDEGDDDLNDDTFGGGGGGGGGGGEAGKPTGKDFDFFGSTSKVTDAINEEGMRFNRHQPSTRPLAAPPVTKPAKKPFKTGYEAYKDPVHVTNLQADPSLWGTAAPQAPVPTARQASFAQPPAVPAASRKMMSLDEIEALMFAQPRPTTESQAPPPQSEPAPLSRQPIPPNHQQDQPFHQDLPPRGVPDIQYGQQQMYPHQRAQPIPPPAPTDNYAYRAAQQQRVELPDRSSPAPAATPSAHAIPQVLQRPPEASQPAPNRSDMKQEITSRPLQILQNPRRQPPQLESRPLTYGPQGPAPGAVDTRALMRGPEGQPAPMPIITHPSQIQELSEDQREAFMKEDAKRAKRNHKIFLLSKDNGLMTPQDKNFITRIQLQQLMTATGNVNEQDPDTMLAEDFYYQVYNQIESRPRMNPNQPLSNFAQTYLFQTGNRPGAMGRRLNRGGDHMHRMQQQVQRAVEAAKAKPKGKQLVIEGSLGKISFSNAKTPKPLLNIRRNDSKVPQVTLSSSDRKSVLKNIEAAYSTLMRMEDHDRMQPPRPANGQNPAAMAAFDHWSRDLHRLNGKLWNELKVMEPIMTESEVLHPFIAFLSYPKGKKAIPRIFMQIDPEQRLTILTIIMVQLDTLDVIRYNLPQFSQQVSPSVAREQTELFLQTVMPTLFTYVTKAPLSIIIGLVGLLTDRVNVAAICHTRVGLELLTMLLSQAEIIHKTETAMADDHPSNTNEPHTREWDSWLGVYNRLFDTVEPVLPEIFPGKTVSAGQDVYVWQFLAAMGTGASPEQQQRLVLGVKDRVMETVRSCKALPAEMAAQRRADVNLFMLAIGLDVEYLDD